MERRDLLLSGLAATGLISIGLAIFLPKSDEERITEQLEGLTEAVGFSEPIENPMFWGAALADRIEPFTADRLQVRVAEVAQRPPTERGRLALAAATVLARFGSFRVTLTELSIDLTPTGARARGMIHVQANVTV